MKKADNHTTAKSILALLVILIAFGIFIIFNDNQDTIIANGNFNSFMLLTTVGMGFLVALLFLASKSPIKATKKKKK